MRATLRAVRGLRRSAGQTGQNTHPWGAGRRRPHHRVGSLRWLWTATCGMWGVDVHDDEVGHPDSDVTFMSCGPQRRASPRFHRRCHLASGWARAAQPSFVVLRCLAASGEMRSRMPARAGRRHAVRPMCPPWNP